MIDLLVYIKGHYLERIIQQQLSMRNQNQKLLQVELPVVKEDYGDKPSLSLSSDPGLTVDELKTKIKVLLGRNTLRGLNKDPSMKEIFVNSTEFPLEQSKYRKKHWQNIYKKRASRYMALTHKAADIGKIHF